MNKIIFPVAVFILAVFHCISSFASKRISETGLNQKEIFTEGRNICSPAVRTDSVKTIAFYLQDGVEVLDFAGPMEVFAYAGYKVFTVSKTRDPIISQGILKIVPDYDIVNAPEADMLVFFGGNSGKASQDEELISWVKNRKNVQYYFSVCTGVFMLAEAGILDGQKATTFHSSLDYLEQSFPKIKVLKGVRFVDNGKVITTAGISAGIDGALHMVAKLQGFGQAKRVAYYMEYDNWTPGNGVLSAENPYLTDRTAKDFLIYTGTYEFLKGASLVIKSGTKGELTAVVNEGETPLFYEKEDKFFTGDGKYVKFQRDNNDKIAGYTLEGTDVLFKKKF